MRWLTLFLLMFLLPTVTTAQEIGDALSRFKIDLDLRNFPQATPEDTLKSVVRAINTKNMDYLMAHLADPVYVDFQIDRIKMDFAKGSDSAKILVAFDKVVQQLRSHFQQDPSLIQELRKLNEKAQWEVGNDTAIARMPNVLNRAAYFKKINNRWYLENRRR